MSFAITAITAPMRLRSLGPKKRPMNSWPTWRRALVAAAPTPPNTVASRGSPVRSPKPAPLAPPKISAPSSIVRRNFPFALSSLLSSVMLIHPAAGRFKSSSGGPASRGRTESTASGRLGTARARTDTVPPSLPRQRACCRRSVGASDPGLGNGPNRLTATAKAAWDVTNCGGTSFQAFHYCGTNRGTTTLNYCFYLYIGGEGGIRTLDGLLTHTPLAGERLQPLGHLSGLVCGQPLKRVDWRSEQDSNLQSPAS